MLHDILNHLSSKPIGFHMSSLWETLQNRMDERPGQPSTPMNTEDFWDFLVEKNSCKRNIMTRGIGPKTYQHHSQDITSWAQKDPEITIISDTIRSTAPEPHSYIIKHQGHLYYLTRHHIHATDFSKNCPISRPSQPPHSSTEPANKKSYIPRP